MLHDQAEAPRVERPTPGHQAVRVQLMNASASSHTKASLTSLRWRLREPQVTALEADSHTLCFTSVLTLLNSKLARVWLLTRIISHHAETHRQVTYSQELLVYDRYCAVFRHLLMAYFSLYSN